MIDALIQGRLFGKAVSHVSANGKPFVVCKVRTAVSDGETIFVSVIGFHERVCSSLLALEDGDSCSLSGALTPKVWTPANREPKPAVDLVCHAVMSAYQVQRKRKAMEVNPSGREQKAGGYDERAYRNSIAPLPDSGL